MVWGAISASGTGDLVKINDLMDKKNSPSGSHLIGPGFIFQEENDPKHSSNYWLKWDRRNLLKH